MFAVFAWCNQVPWGINMDHEVWSQNYLKAIIENCSQGFQHIEWSAASVSCLSWCMLMWFSCFSKRKLAPSIMSAIVGLRKKAIQGQRGRGAKAEAVAAMQTVAMTVHPKPFEKKGWCWLKAVQRSLGFAEKTAPMSSRCPIIKDPDPVWQRAGFTLWRFLRHREPMKNKRCPHGAGTCLLGIKSWKYENAWNIEANATRRRWHQMHDVFLVSTRRRFEDMCFCPFTISAIYR